MELLVASAIGLMAAAGIYLVLRGRSYPVVLGLSLLTYATNAFLFAAGRLAVDAAPVLRAGVSAYADPLPQALVLTAIVIAFGMTAMLVVLALRSYVENADDRVDDDGGEQQDAAAAPAAEHEAPR